MGAESEVPRVVRDRVYAMRHGLLGDDVGRAVETILESGLDDEFAHQTLRKRVRDHQVARFFEGEFAAPQLPQGELILGFDTRGQRVHCPLQALNAHSLMLGGSGAGKTTRSRFMALQVVPRVQGAWLMDLRKREFAMLRPYLARTGVELIVLPARLMRFNPLQVPRDVEPLDWAAAVSDMLVRVLTLPPRASKLLNIAIVRQYEQRGVLRALCDFPTLFDVREDVAGSTEANAPAKHALLDALDAVLVSIGVALRYRVGWTSSDLAARRIVFEFGGIPEPAKNLILNALLLAEFTSRIARGVSNPRMNLWICLDEAARIVSSSNPTGGLSDLSGLIRGTGIGLDLGVQSAEIAPSILSNSATKVIGRCGSATDYELMSAAIGLTREQQMWIKTHIVPGLFVGQLGEGPWREPFIFRVPPLHMPQHEPPSSALGDLPALPAVPSQGGSA